MRLILFYFLFQFSIIVGAVESALVHQPPTNQINPFKTDLCTFSPQGFLPIVGKNYWRHCCIEHDIAHWAAGNEQHRLNADQRLEECVTSQGGPGKQFFQIVQRFGHPKFGKIFPVNLNRNFPWGYGWNFYIGHQELNAKQKESVCDELNKWSTTQQFYDFWEEYNLKQNEEPYLLGCEIFR